MHHQTETHNEPHPTFDRLKFLNRRAEQIQNSNKIKGDDSFFSVAQEYVNELRLATIEEERETLLALCN